MLVVHEQDEGVVPSVAAGCPGATIPFLPPGDPRRGPPNVPMIDDPRCANDFQALGDLTSGGTAPVSSTSEVWGAAGTATLQIYCRRFWRDSGRYLGMTTSAP